MDGCFSLSGFRVFGKGEGAAPSKVTGFRAIRNSEDKRMFRFTWDAQKGLPDTCYGGDHRKIS